MNLSVVIAAYNERENIEELTRRLDAVLRAMPETRSEMIFVVEGRDGTREILESLAAELGRIRVLYQEDPSGLGNAFRRGFAAVSPDADFVVTMDADLNHRPEEIPRLLEDLLRENADVLVGSRFVEGSESEGIPLWKRVVSGLMNRVIASLFDIAAKDKTSGFRVYRAEALRQLSSYRNNDFAFLPEMLIRATELGLKIAEAPIHFTFRTRGESKMSIPQTSRSYLTLLRTRFDDWSIVALTFLCAGIAVRVLYAFPVHKYPADADSLLSAMRAFDIREGDLRVFFCDVRIGALESYLHLPAFLLLGVSREAVGLAPLFAGILTLLAFFFFVRELLGREVACFALLFMAFPSPAYMAWTYMPNGYGETLLFCAATLWLVARIARKGVQGWSSLLLGLSAGLGGWNSVQTITCAAPAILWLAFRRPRILRLPRFLLPALAGLLLGAAPWIAYNAVYSFASLEGNFAVRPAKGAEEFLSNASYFLKTQVGELTLEVNPYDEPREISPVQRALRLPAVGIYLLAGIALLTGSFFRRPLAEQRKRGPQPGAFLLLWLTAGTIALAYVFSEAGTARSPTVRYVLPLYIVIAAGLGVAIFLTAKSSRVVALLLALTLVLFHLSAYALPWTPQRRYWAELKALDEKLLEFLETHRVRWVSGNYWIVYSLNFLSEERVLGVPFQELADHYGYGRGVPVAPSRWALVTRTPETMTAWLAGTGLKGTTVPVGPGFFVFLPDSAERARPSREVLTVLRQNAPQGH